MKVVIIGGTKLVATKLTSALCEKGHKVVPASHRTDLNTIAGESLGSALSGADIVIDVADSTSLNDGATHLHETKCDRRLAIDKPFRSIHFYVPTTELSSIREQYGARRVGQLDCLFGTGFRDEAVHHTGALHLQGLPQQSEPNQLFVDHMILALAAYIAQAYGDLRNSEPLSGGLAPWQVKRACDRLQADLAGKLTLEDIATEVGISSSHFSRAFRASVGLPPHQWLLRQRVSAAKQLMTVRSLTLAEIAIAAGFANQSHFTRVFSTLVGVSPGAWRRDVQGASVLGSS
ncbi:AraC family transcriptional regulator [Bradyrhizobium mercantei]|uniref:AraC family transcriptional regulator n=1 Tax=Bradyrhizobium mercantei TaxID=1904807 RepID=UPI0009780F81|nr:AraC family transcriptional regulator [Bradyrhizobium mercantei]